MNTQGIVDALVSHAASLGYFDSVNEHEPLSPPGTGLTVAVWADRISPVPGGSGLAATSARLALMVRVYAGASTLPTDSIDPEVVAAVDALMAAYSGDFDLGGLVRNVDLLGQAGEPMAAQAGWITYPDGRVFRVVTITVPVIVNNAWTQAP